LYFLLLHGVRALAAMMLGSGSTVELIEPDGNALFERVMTLSVEPVSPTYS
jgi:hypothetical protein